MLAWTLAAQKGRAQRGGGRTAAVEDGDRHGCDVEMTRRMAMTRLKLKRKETKLKTRKKLKLKLKLTMQRTMERTMERTRKMERTLMERTLIERTLKAEAEEDWRGRERGRSRGR